MKETLRLRVGRNAVRSASDKLIQLKTGWLGKLAAARSVIKLLTDTGTYVALGSLSFVFLYPLLFMVSRAFMQPSDIVDAMVQWVPKELSFDNFQYAFQKLNYWRHFANSIIIAFGSAALQIIGCSIAGYGFARYRFPGYKLLLGLLLFTFLVPPQSIIVPIFLFYSDLEWTNTYLPFFVPSLLGHGLRGALFVLVFIQFFRGLPGQLEEAARIDGAGAIRTFLSVMLPLARPAILVVFLFSVVWHWNDTFLANLYLSENAHFSLNQILGLIKVDSANEGMGMESGGGAIGTLPTNYEKLMAGAVLSILPMLALYLFAQRYFVEGVERTGIAGE